MAALRIQYPDDHSNLTSWYTRHILCGPIQMNLDQQLAGGASEPATYAFLQTMIHATDHSVVYRACLGDELEAVVLKFSVDDESIADLRREATAYTSVLKELQGSVIPSFYGIYHGTCSHGRDVSCIVLQDCGDSIKTEFRELPIEERHAILEQLGKFHIVSKCHPRDLAERNVVAKDGQYRLIDFHTLIEHHCEFDGRWGFGEYMRMDFGCDLLAEPALIEFRVWKRNIPARVNLFGSTYPVTECPSQNVVDQLVKEDESLGYFWNKEYALEWLEDVRNYATEEGLDSDDEDDVKAILEHAREIKPVFYHTIDEAVEFQKD